MVVMSGRIRRYIPSFKRRRLNEDRPSTFLDDSGSESSPVTRENNEKKDLHLGRIPEPAESHRLPTRTENAVGSQWHRLRHIAKRDEDDDTPVVDIGLNPVPEIIDGIVGNEQSGSPDGVTVTVSIGVSLQVSTVSSDGSTFVSVSTALFTLDSSGGISTPTLVPTTTLPLLETSLPSLSTSLSSGIEAVATPQAATPGSSTASSISTTSQISVPIASATEDETSRIPLTTVTSLYQTFGPNMTDYLSIGRARTSTRDGTVIVFSERSGSRTSSRDSSSPTSSYTSASDSSSTTTIFPADGDLPAPQSPTPTLDSDSETDANGDAETPMGERLPPILGGVFGGLAGAALVLWALLFLLRKRRRASRGGAGFLGLSSGRNQRGLSQDNAPSAMSTAPQAGGSILPSLFAPALFGRSSASTPPPPSEQGFVKISGRKLPSMYGDDMVPTSMTVASARASASEPGSRNVSGGTHPTMGGSHHQEDDSLVPMPVPFQPSPAKTAMRSGSPALASRIAEHEQEPGPSTHPQPPPPPPLIHDPGEGSTRFPTPPPGVIRRMHSSIGADGVGRSLASQDGSKTSRFTEDV